MAKQQLEQAIQLVRNEVELDFLKKKLQGLDTSFF